MLTTEAAVMVVQRHWSPISATVPEGWSWERITALVRVCGKICKAIIVGPVDRKSVKAYVSNVN